MAALTAAPATRAQCPEEPPVQNFVGGGAAVCPCFAIGEEAGSVLDVPPGDYPIQILRVGVGYGSVFGSQGDFLEQAIHIYPAGLPNPGTPIFSLVGPQLTDGFINEFDFSVFNVIVDSGPFTVTLEFAEPNVNDFFHGTVTHDANGCTPAYLQFRKVSIYSGSNEIQRNIIAKAELEL